MTLRVLLLADFYPPHLGGVELQVQALARALADGGSAVCVATVRQPGLGAEERDGAIRVVRLRALYTAVPWFSSSSARRYLPPLPDPRLALALRRLVREFRPDVVQAHGWSAYSAALAMTGTTVPLVVSVRDYGYTCATRSLLVDGRICEGPSWERCLRHANRTYGTAKGIAAVTGVLTLRRWLATRTSVAHAVSRYVAQIVERDLFRGRHAVDRPTGRVAIIADIVPDGPVVDPGETTTSAVSGARLPDGPFILFVGALQPHKGLGPLITAYRCLTSAPPLVMIGTRWPDTPPLPDDVIVLSDVPHAEVMAAWDRCLFGVVPSVWPDPLPGVVREAMSRGKPVVGSAVGGIVDMVEDEVTGLLVPPGDVAALTVAMQRLLDDGALRERLGERARVNARQFDAASVAATFCGLYERLVSGSSPSEAQPRRIHLIGDQGAGKTTVATRLGEQLGVAVHHLDDITRDPVTGLERPQEELREIAEGIAASPAWVTEGLHTGWTSSLFERADRVVWLDTVGRGTAARRIVGRFAGNAWAESRRRGWRGLFRFRAYGRHVEDLARTMMRVAVSGRVAGRDAGGEPSTADLETLLQRHPERLIRCRSDAEVRAFVASVRGDDAARGPRAANGDGSTR